VFGRTLADFTNPILFDLLPSHIRPAKIANGL
jgi:hypothetical protein